MTKMLQFLLNYFVIYITTDVTSFCLKYLILPYIKIKSHLSLTRTMKNLISIAYKNNEKMLK